MKISRVVYDVETKTPLDMPISKFPKRYEFIGSSNEDAPSKVDLYIDSDSSSNLAKGSIRLEKKYTDNDNDNIYEAINNKFDQEDLKAKNSNGKNKFDKNNTNVGRSQDYNEGERNVLEQLGDKALGYLNQFTEVFGKDLLNKENTNFSSHSFDNQLTKLKSWKESKYKDLHTTNWEETDILNPIDNMANNRNSDMRGELGKTTGGLGGIVASSGGGALNLGTIADQLLGGADTANSLTTMYGSLTGKNVGDAQWAADAEDIMALNTANKYSMYTSKPGIKIKVKDGVIENITGKSSNIFASRYSEKNGNMISSYGTELDLIREKEIENSGESSSRTFLMGTDNLIHKKKPIYGLKKSVGSFINLENKDGKLVWEVNEEVYDSVNLSTEQAHFVNFLKNRNTFYKNIGYLYIRPFYTYKTNDKDVDTDNGFGVFDIPFEFNPNISETSAQANYVSETLLGRLGQFHIYTGTNLPQLSIELTYNALAPDDLDEEDISNMGKQYSTDAWEYYWTPSRMEEIENKLRSLVFADYVSGNGYLIKPPIVELHLENTMGDTVSRISDLYRYPSSATNPNSVDSNYLSYTTSLKGSNGNRFKKYIVTSVQIDKIDDTSYDFPSLYGRVYDPMYANQMNPMYHIYTGSDEKSSYGYNGFARRRGFKATLQLMEVTENFLDLVPDFKAYYDAWNISKNRADTINNFAELATKTGKEDIMQSVKDILALEGMAALSNISTGKEDINMLFDEAEKLAILYARILSGLKKSVDGIEQQKKKWYDWINPETWVGFFQKITDKKVETKSGYLIGDFNNPSRYNDYAFLRYNYEEGNTTSYNTYLDYKYNDKNYNLLCDFNKESKETLAPIPTEEMKTESSYPAGDEEETKEAEETTEKTEEEIAAEEEAKAEAEKEKAEEEAKSIKNNKEFVISLADFERETQDEASADPGKTVKENFFYIKDDKYAFLDSPTASRDGIFNIFKVEDYNSFIWDYSSGLFKDKDDENSLAAAFIRDSDETRNYSIYERTIMAYLEEYYNLLIAWGEMLDKEISIVFSETKNEKDIENYYLEDNKDAQGSVAGTRNVKVYMDNLKESMKAIKKVNEENIDLVVYGVEDGTAIIKYDGTNIEDLIDSALTIASQVDEKGKTKKLPSSIQKLEDYRNSIISGVANSVNDGLSYLNGNYKTILKDLNKFGVIEDGYSNDINSFTISIKTTAVSKNISLSDYFSYADKLEKIKKFDVDAYCEDLKSFTMNHNYKVMGAKAMIAMLTANICSLVGLIEGKEANLYVLKYKEAKKDERYDLYEVNNGYLEKKDGYLYSKSKDNVNNEYQLVKASQGEYSIEKYTTKIFTAFDLYYAIVKGYKNARDSLVNLFEENADMVGVNIEELSNFDVEIKESVDDIIKENKDILSYIKSKDSGNKKFGAMTSDEKVKLYSAIQKLRDSIVNKLEAARLTMNKYVAIAMSAFSLQSIENKFAEYFNYNNDKYVENTVFETLAKNYGFERKDEGSGYQDYKEDSITRTNNIEGQSYLCYKTKGVNTLKAVMFPDERDNYDTDNISEGDTSSVHGKIYKAYVNLKNLEKYSKDIERSRAASSSRDPSSAVEQPSMINKEVSC